MKYILIACLAFSFSAFADVNLDSGKTLYDAKCAKCHGKSGGGDGKSAKALNAKEEELSFQDPKRFEDKRGLDMTPEQRMFKAIKEGGPAVKQSKEMDAFPDYTDQEINDMIEYIRTFSKK